MGHKTAGDGQEEGAVVLLGWERSPQPPILLRLRRKNPLALSFPQFPESENPSQAGESPRNPQEGYPPDERIPSPALQAASQVGSQSPPEVGCHTAFLTPALDNPPIAGQGRLPQVGLGHTCLC